MNWPVVDTIHPLHNKFTKGVKMKPTGELKLDDSHADYSILWPHANYKAVG